MKKLNQKKIRWIIRHMENGLNSDTVARSQKISRRRVQQIYKRYKETNIVPILHKPGRKAKHLADERIELINKTYDEHKIGPLALEKIMQREHKIHIPHNAIYKHMLQRELIQENPNKKKQRKWVRYERKHSLSLVHTDWCEYKGKQVVAFLDDASRNILSCMEFNDATTKNTTIALNKAIEFVEPYGKIEQLISDHGTQFTANKKDKKGIAEHRFEQYLKEKGIKQLFARVKHPQTNGKMERWFGIYKQQRYRFDKLEKFVAWYNDKKPHMSLNFNKAETPSEAFVRKMRTEVWFGFAKHWF